jgi:hypothetical protein
MEQHIPSTDYGRYEGGVPSRFAARNHIHRRCTKQIRICYRSVKGSINQVPKNCQVWLPRPDGRQSHARESPTAPSSTCRGRIIRFDTRAMDRHATSNCHLLYVLDAYDTKTPTRRSGSFVYVGSIWSGRRDLNSRPLGPKPSALPG